MGDTVDLTICSSDNVSPTDTNEKICSFPVTLRLAQTWDEILKKHTDRILHLLRNEVIDGPSLRDDAYRICEELVAVRENAKALGRYNNDQVHDTVTKCETLLASLPKD